MDKYSNLYFLKKYCSYSEDKNKVMVSNQYKTSYITIPKEFFDLLIYSYENKIKVGDLFEFISKDLIKDFVQTIEYMDKLELLDENYDKTFNLDFVPKVVVSVTNRCNLSCKYCCTDSCKDCEEELTTEEVKKVFDFAIDLKSDFINISGGEPLLRKNIVDELSYLRENYSGIINLSTNATCLDRVDIDILLESIDQMSITLDGYDEETCSKVRNRKTFKHVVDNIKKIQEKGFSNIICSMVLGESTYEHKDKFIDFCNGLNVKFSFNYFMKVGRGNYCTDYLSDENYVDYLDPDDNLRGDGVNSCRAAESQVFIDSRGNVYPCPLLSKSEYYIGNVLEGGKELSKKILLKEGTILEVLDKLELLRPSRCNECSNCKYKLFCIKCIYTMHKMKENHYVFEKNCYRRRVILEKGDIGIK